MWHHHFFEGRRRIALDWLRAATSGTSGAWVVDVGCGPGILTDELRRAGCRVLGLDRAPGMVREAVAGGARGACSDALSLPVRDGAADAAVALGLASYVEDLEALLRELGRVVRPGGEVVVSVANRGAPDWWMRSLLRAPARLLGFRGLLTSDVQLQTRTRAQVVDAARAAGLELLEIVGHDFTLFPVSRLLPGPSVQASEALEAFRSERLAGLASEFVVRARRPCGPTSRRTAPSRPVRVARVIARLNVGGPALHVTLATAGLRPRYETTLATGRVADGEVEATDLLERHDVRPVRVPGLGRKLSALDDLAAFTALLGLFRRTRPEVVHTHTAKAGALGRVAARVAGVPVVVHTFHGHVLSGYFGPVGSWLAARIEQVLSWTADRVLAVSSQVADDLSDRFGAVSRSRLAVVPIGLELEPFLDDSAPRGALRQELGLGEETPVAVFLGRMVPVKEPEVALAVWARVRERLPDAVLLMVGSGGRREELEPRGDPGVLWLGWRRDTARILRDVDLALLTSRNEGTPVALIEASAAGVPSVATDVGGVSAVVRHDRTGLLCAHGDVQALADAVVGLLESPERRRELGAAAREHVAERFSAARLLRDLDELYTELLVTRRR